jgi:Tol biopolymer transport system component
VSYIKHNATYCPYSNAENVISSKIYFLGGETLYNRSFLAYDLKGQRWIRDNSYQPNIDLGVPIELAEIPHSNYYPLHVTGVCLDQAGTSNIYYWTYNNTNNYFYKYSVGHNNWETLSYVPLNYSFPRFGFAKNSRAHFVGGGNTVGSNTVSVFDPVNGMWSVSTIGGLPMGNGTMGLGFNPANQFISSGSFLQRYDLTQLPTPTIVITPPPVVTPTFTPTPTPTTLPTLIPNSDKIVYTSTPPNQGDNIYIMNADGTNKTRLTEGADASLSPNGNQITFHSNKLGGTNVYIMNVDGSNVRALTNTTDWVNMNATPAFSPDGTRIAFMSVLQVQNPSDKPNIKTMDSSNGGAIYNLTSDVTNYAYTPHYSPDGTKIVYRATVNNGSSNDIFIMDAANGNHKINITNNHPIDEYSPVFSPDGNRIAFESNRDGNNEIYIMDINGNNPTRITNHPKNDRDPSFSPDGKFVVFNSDRDGDYEIFMVDINAGTLFQLTSNSYPDISPSFITPQGPIDITTCATDCDCVCGYPNGSSQCTYLNKLYADPNSRLTCSMTPDFCTGISGTGNPACINGRCAFRDNYPVNCASSKN